MGVGKGEMALVGGLGVRPHPNPPPEGEGISGREGEGIYGLLGGFVRDGGCMGMLEMG